MPFRTLCLSLCLFAGAAGAEVPRVVTDIAPVHGLVARVMDGVGTPQLIVRPGAAAHGYALRPSDAAALEQAELVIWIGPEMTPWLDRARARLAADAQSIALANLPGTTRLTTRDTALFGDDGHDHGDSHDHGGIDPHVWLDPENAQNWLVQIAEALALQDPESGSVYRANATAGAAEIAAATHEISNDLEGLDGRPFLVYHDALQYFERRFGLQAQGALSLSDDTPPSPARIATLRDAVRDHGATCLLAEPGFNPKLVAAVFEGTHAPVSKIVDVMGTGVEQGPELYPALLRGIAEAVVACLR